jgi:hypothetical protein
VKRLQVGGSGVKIPAEARDFAFSTPSQLILWPIQMHIWQQWYESENSLPHSAEVKNEWIYTSTAPYITSWCVPEQLAFTIVRNYYGWVVTILRTRGYDHINSTELFT